MADITIAIRDDNGTIRRVTKIMPMRDGFGVSAPYHAAKRGFLFKHPMIYDRTEGIVPFDECIEYTAEDRVKLSIHLGGFVQFSQGGKKPILSGYDEKTGEIKGLGLKAPNPVDVSSGPLWGITIKNLEEFGELGLKQAVIFEQDDLWFHPYHYEPGATAYALEAFMFPQRRLREVRTIGGRPILRTYLPFNSLFRFKFDLRVVRLPNLPMFLGLILHRMATDDDTGFVLSGPGCGGPGERKMGISAWYPLPDFVTNAKSLDYQPPQN